jgi:hypothetical protein
LPVKQWTSSVVNVSELPTGLCSARISSDRKSRHVTLRPLRILLASGAACGILADAKVDAWRANRPASPQRSAEVLPVWFQVQNAFECGAPVPPERARALHCAASEIRRSDGATRIMLVVLSQLIDWRRVLTVLQPATLIRWHRKGFRLFWTWKSRPRGRPRVPVNVRRLIADMAEANVTWGEERIAAELLL